MALAEKTMGCREADEEKAARLDGDAASEFGFDVLSIKAVRHDLATYLHMHEHGAFEHYDRIRRRLGGIRKAIAKEFEFLSAELSDLTVPCRDKFKADALVTELSTVIGRVQTIEDALPRRAADVRDLAVRYLLAFWKHETRSEGYVGTRDIRLTFDSETSTEPRHPSMRFIYAMLERTGNQRFKGVSRSTIARAKRALGADIPNPNEILPFKGDPDLLEWY